MQIEDISILEVAKEVAKYMKELEKWKIKIMPQAEENELIYLYGQSKTCEIFERENKISEKQFNIMYVSFLQTLSQIEKEYGKNTYKQIIDLATKINESEQKYE